MNRKQILSFLLGAAALMLGLAASQPARAEVQVNKTVPIAFRTFVPCANGGSGEYIDISGPLHILMTFTMDGNGGVHGVFHSQPQDVIAVGEITGDLYHSVGVTEGTFNTTVGSVSTYVNNFYAIGPGSTPNLYIRDVAIMTINADGTLTANVDLYTIECR